MSILQIRRRELVEVCMGRCATLAHEGVRIPLKSRIRHDPLSRFRLDFGNDPNGLKVTARSIVWSGLPSCLECKEATGSTRFVDASMTSWSTPPPLLLYTWRRLKFHNSSINGKTKKKKKKEEDDGEEGIRGMKVVLAHAGIDEWINTERSCVSLLFLSEV